MLFELTAAEVQNTPEPVQIVYAELVIMGAEVLEVGESALELTDEYQRRNILTPGFYDDGLHIATVAEADVLVSWNFKHIVRFDKIRLFNSVHLE